MPYSLTRTLSGFSLRGPGVNARLFTSDEALAHGVKACVEGAYRAGKPTTPRRRHHRSHRKISRRLTRSRR